jgi:cobalamin-dependent methionine synthase I
MLPSTETPVLKTGLENLGGRCTINSDKGEGGDGPEPRFRKTMELVAEHGAAVVALTIDEEVGPAPRRRRSRSPCASQTSPGTGESKSRQS